MAKVNKNKASDVSNSPKLYPVVCLMSAFLFKKPEGSVEAVECPGCSRILDNREMCAGHLLRECLQLSKNAKNSEQLRDQWIKWLFQYFFYNFIAGTKTTYNIKDSNTDHQSPEEGGSNVLIKNIPSDLQCPICEQVIYPASKCYNRLFNNCLRTKTGMNAVHVGKWIEEYLWLNCCKSRTDCIIVQDQVQNSGKPAICKYYKKEFSDKTCTRNHFRSNHCRQNDRSTHTRIICTFCNLKLASPAALFNHLVLRHLKLSCCEFKIKINRNTPMPFEALKNHI